MTRRVAIVASGPSGVDAPFHSPRWEVWATGWRTCDLIERCDRFYEVHSADTFSDKPRYMEFLNAVHVYSLFPDVGTLIQADRIEAAFGTEFLTNSVAWMMADALLENVDVLGLWGVEMDYESEYWLERYGVKHFMRLAEERGVELVVPEGCPLLTDIPAYPFRGAA